jgi:hypothetical protein
MSSGREERLLLETSNSLREAREDIDGKLVRELLCS